MIKTDFAPQFKKRKDLAWIWIVATLILFIIAVAIFKPELNCFDLFINQCA